MLALVTGATGFIGSHVIEALLRAGHQPLAAVRGSSDTTLLQQLGVPMVTCDVTDAESLRAACRDVDCVIHTAAVVSTYGSWEHYRRVGVEGTRNVVEAAVSAGVPRFVHLGSIAVYGFEHPEGTLLTEDLPLATDPEPWNHYVREKALSEQVVWRAHAAGRIAVTSIRPSVVLGVRDRAVVTRMSRILSSPFGGLVGWGENRVGCVVVEDLARLVVAAATAPEARGRAYNASGARIVLQRELVEAYAEAFGVRVPPWRVPAKVALWGAGLLDEAYATLGRSEEPMFSRLSAAILGLDFAVDCRRAEAELGWRGESDHVAAIRASVAHFQSTKG